MLNLANVSDDFKMQWDYRDMIASINLGGGGVAHYQYDAGKQRTRKTITKNNGHIVEERIYLGGLELYRRVDNGVLKEEIKTLHLFDSEQRLLMVDQILETDNASLGTRTLYRYTLSNHLGSSTVSLDDKAGIISYEEYHPYGTSAYRARRNAAEVEVKLKRYRYTGMERDEESGLSYHTARYYLPWLGRWVSVDPAGAAIGSNFYLYADLTPCRASDTSGLQPTYSDKTETGEILPGGVRAVPVPLPPSRPLLEPEIPSQFRLPTFLPWRFALPDQRPSVSVAKGPIDPRIHSAEYQKALRESAQWDSKPPLEKLAALNQQHAEGDLIRWISQWGPLANALASRSQTPDVPTHAKVPAGPWKPPAPTFVGDAAGLRSQMPQSSHVGASDPNKPEARSKAKTVANAGPNKCVGNSCALMLNEEMGAGVSEGFTTAELEAHPKVRGNKIFFGRTSTGASNPNVATARHSLSTVEKVTAAVGEPMRVTNRNAPVDFARAQQVGHYLIFFGDDHVIYARIRDNGRVNILDPSVGKGWSSWNDFVEYAEANPNLYSSNPRQVNQAYRFEYLRP